MHFFVVTFIQIVSEILRWLFNNYIEILATLTGMIYLLYSIEGKIQLWFFGLITSSLYIYVFYSSGIYADMAINIYYVFISIYGWYHWKYPGRKSIKELPISRLKFKTGLTLLLVSLLLFLAIAILLIEFTDSVIPWGDAFTTAFSITATWMLARKIMEHWLIWILVDLVSVILYIYKGLYPTVILFILYTTLAIAGYLQWRKLWKTQSDTRSESY